MNELIKKSATELAKLIQSKEISSREIVQAHLDRINEVNPDINAVTVILEESALALSDQADNASDDERNRPFHGVPITKTFPITGLDTITIYLGKKNQLAYYEPILSSNARRIIFNPGAENNELATLASKKGIEIVEGCTLVMLTLKQY